MSFTDPTKWAPSLQAFGKALAKAGLEPPPTPYDPQLAASTEKIRHIHHVTTEYDADRERIKDSIVFIGPDTEETLVDPNTTWGKLSHHQRRRILYKKRLDLAHFYADPTSYSELDYSPEASVRAIEECAEQGLKLFISRSYEEPLLEHKLHVTAESNMFRVKDWMDGRGGQAQHQISAELTAGDIVLKAIHTQQQFLGQLRVTVPISLNHSVVNYEYQQREVMDPYPQYHTAHQLQYITSDRRSVTELKHQHFDTNANLTPHNTPLTTTRTTTSLSNSYNITPNLHVGVKFKNVLSYPTPEQTTQNWYCSARLRWRDFYRIIWDDSQHPYPMDPRSDLILEGSTKNFLKIKYWGFLDSYSPIETSNNHIVTAYVKMNPNKPAYNDLNSNKNVIDAGVSYTFQDNEHSNSLRGIYAKLCGYIKLFAGGPVPGQPALSWKASAAVNVFNLTRPTLGVDLSYNTAHRFGYDTLLKPRGFIPYRLPILDSKEDYDESLNYADVITRWHEQQLAMFYSETHREEYLKDQIMKYQSLLYPEDQLTDCTEEEFAYIVHDDEFIKHHPVLSKLPYKMAKTYHYRDPKTQRIVMPSAFAIKRYQQHRVYPRPADAKPGDVTPPRFPGDEVENMFYWGWFVRKKDTQLPQTVQEIANNETYRLWMSMYRYESLLKAMDRLHECRVELLQLDEQDRAVHKEQNVLKKELMQIVKEQDRMTAAGADKSKQQHHRDVSVEKQHALSDLYEKQLLLQKQQQTLQYNITDLENHIHYLRHREEFQKYLNLFYDKKDLLDKKQKWAHLNNLGDYHQSDAKTKKLIDENYDESDLILDQTDPAHQRYYHPEEVYLKSFNMFNQRYENYLQQLQKQFKLSLIKDHEENMQYYVPTNSPQYRSLLQKQQLHRMQQQAALGDKLAHTGLQDHQTYYGLRLDTEDRYNKLSSLPPALKMQGEGDDVYDLSLIGNVTYRKLLTYFDELEQIKQDNRDTIPSHPLQFNQTIDGSNDVDVVEQRELQKNYLSDVLQMIIPRSLTTPITITPHRHDGDLTTSTTTKLNVMDNVLNLVGNFFSPRTVTTNTSITTTITSTPSSSPASSSSSSSWTPPFLSSFNKDAANTHLHSLANVILDKHLDRIPRSAYTDHQRGSGDQHNIINDKIESVDTAVLKASWMDEGMKVITGIQYQNEELNAMNQKRLNLHALPSNLNAFLNEDDIVVNLNDEKSLDQFPLRAIEVKKRAEEAEDLQYRMLRDIANTSTDTIYDALSSLRGAVDATKEDMAQRKLLVDQEMQIRSENQQLFKELLDEEQRVILSQRVPEYIDDGIATANRHSPLIQSLVHESVEQHFSTPHESTSPTTPTIFQLNAPTQLTIPKMPMPAHEVFLKRKLENRLDDDGNLINPHDDIIEMSDEELDAIPLTKDHINTEAALRFLQVGMLPEEEYRHELSMSAKKRDLGLHDDTAVQSDRQHRLQTRLQAQIALVKQQENQKKLENLKLYLDQYENNQEMEKYYENLLLTKDIYPIPYTMEYELEMSGLDEKLSEIHQNLKKLEDKLLGYDKKVLEYQIRALEHPTNQHYFDAYNQAMKDREEIGRYYNDERKHIEKLENELMSQKTNTTFRYLYRNTMLPQDEIEQHNIASQERYKQAILRAQKEEELMKSEIKNAALFGVERYFNENPIILSTTADLSRDDMYNLPENEREIAQQNARDDVEKQMRLEQRNTILHWYNEYHTAQTEKGYHESDILNIDDFVKYKYHELLEEDTKTDLLLESGEALREFIHQVKHSTKPPNIIVDEKNNAMYLDTSNDDVLYVLNEERFDNVLDKNKLSFDENTAFLKQRTAQIRAIQKHMLLKDNARQHGYYPHHIRDQLEVPSTMFVSESGRDDPQYQQEQHLLTHHDQFLLQSKYLEGITTTDAHTDPTSIEAGMNDMFVTSHAPASSLFPDPNDLMAHDKKQRAAMYEHGNTNREQYDAMHSHDPMALKPTSLNLGGMPGSDATTHALITGQPTTTTPRRRTRAGQDDPFDYLLSATDASTYHHEKTNASYLSPTQPTTSTDRFNLSRYGQTLEQRVHDVYEKYEEMDARDGYHSAPNDQYKATLDNPAGEVYPNYLLSSTQPLSKDTAIQMYAEFDRIGEMYHLSPQDVDYLRENVETIWNMRQRTAVEQSLEDHRLQSFRIQRAERREQERRTQHQRVVMPPGKDPQNNEKKDGFVPAYQSTMLYNQLDQHKHPDYTGESQKRGPHNLKMTKDRALDELMYHADIHNPERFEQFEMSLRQRGMHPDMLYTNPMYTPVKTQPREVWQELEDKLNNPDELDSTLSKISPINRPFAMGEARDKVANTITRHTFATNNKPASHNSNHNEPKMSFDPEFEYNEFVPGHVLYQQYHQGAQQSRQDKLAALRREDNVKLPKGGKDAKDAQLMSRTGGSLQPAPAKATTFGSSAFRQMTMPGEPVEKPRPQAPESGASSEQHERKNKLFGDSSRAYFSDHNNNSNNGRH